MAYITHTERTISRHPYPAGPSLLSEVASTWIVPRVTAAAERLSTRDDLPFTLRHPQPDTRSMLRPRIDSAALWRSARAYVETRHALSKGAGLADLGMTESDIADVALLSAFGWCLTAERPNPESTRLARLKSVLSAMRRKFAPTDDELEEAYLAAAQDLHDLEHRIRDLDLRRRSDRARRVGGLGAARW